ncbi:MAG: alpha/beta hydrolase, partial [Candidatus Rokuibacteriota bacterium]
MRGVLHRPAGPAGDSVVLAHGAGGNSGAPLLVALASALAASGLTVLRCDLPFRQARPSGPPPPGVAAHDREGLRSALLAVRQLVPGRAFLGGHSYGGRQASL